MQEVKALLFDIFGTCVDWRTTVARTLTTAAHTTLNSPTASIASTVRLTASNMSSEDWARFEQEWRDSYKNYVRAVASDPSIPFKTIDEHHLDSLRDLLKKWELDGLWTDEEVMDLSLVWHRLDAWQDSASGLKKLTDENGLTTATLSNGNVSLLRDLCSHNGVDFTHLFSAEMWKSYKPSPKVYLGAVEKLGLKPEQCAMVAAHLGDLKAAKVCGLRTVYVERAMEEDFDAGEVEEARGWVDVWIAQDRRGLVALSEELGRLGGQ